jgi:hypothetical protein
MSELFPLPLSPFEYYYFCDDSNEYPTTFPVEMVFSPGLGRAELQRALEVIVPRHPLLRSLVADVGRRGPCWIGDGEPPAVDWACEGRPMSHAEGGRIDLRRSPGLRVWAREGPDSTRVVLQFHHACCDGLGATRFVEDLLVGYARECGVSAHQLSLPQLDPANLAKRAALNVPSRSIYAVIRDWLIGARMWTKFAWQSAAPLAGSASLDGSNGYTARELPSREGAAVSSPAGAASESTRAASSSETTHIANGRGTAPCPPESAACATPGKDLPALGFITHSLDAALIARLREAARKSGCTVNDLLLCGLFMAARSWNLRHGQDHGLLRINMPVTIGQRSDKLMPAANSLTFAFLNRRSRQCDQPEKLLEGIRRETEAIKRHHLGMYFVGGLDMFRNVPGLIPFFLKQAKCRATAVLSNMGRQLARTRLPHRHGRLVCGNAVLQSFAGVPPIRPLTRASILFMTYAGATSLHLRCDPRYFDCEGRKEFLAEYTQNLERAAQL